MSRRLTHAVLALAGAVLAACSSGATVSPTPTSGVRSPKTTPSAAAGSASRIDAGHVIVVVMENKPASAIAGNPAAPYLNALARHGASYTRMSAVRHPSQPNYIALFSGGTHGVTDDSCPRQLTGPNLAQQLRQAGLTFVGYSEGLPAAGSTTCSDKAYVRKHAPWTDFAALPDSVNQPLTAFPHDYAGLPTVAWVIPDLNHDMHDGTITQADTWARRHLSRYVAWAASHHSVLVVTWDEDDHSAGNHIATFVIGAGVAPRTVTTSVTLYSLLRAIEDRYGLAPIGAAATAPPMSLT